MGSLYVSSELHMPPEKIHKHTCYGNKLTVHNLKIRCIQYKYTNDVTIKSHEQGLITKKYIAIHTN